MIQNEPQLEFPNDRNEGKEGSKTDYLTSITLTFLALATIVLSVAYTKERASSRKRVLALHSQYFGIWISRTILRFETAADFLLRASPKCG